MFGNFDCIIFELKGESCVVILTVLYLDLRWGGARFVLLTVLYLDLRGSGVLYF